MLNALQDGDKEKIPGQNDLRTKKKSSMMAVNEMRIYVRRTESKLVASPSNTSSINCKCTYAKTYSTDHSLCAIFISIG